MTRRAWWIFLAIQLTGLCALAETAFMGMLTALWPIVPFIVLLPGSAVWLAVDDVRSRFNLESVASGFTLLFVNAVVAIGINVLLFAVLSSSLKKIRFRRRRIPS